MTKLANNSQPKVLQMALALATEDGRKSRQAGERISVKDTHVSMVMKRHEDFEDYQKQRSGGSRDKIANDDGRRLLPEPAKLGKMTRRM